MEYPSSIIDPLCLLRIVRVVLSLGTAEPRLKRPKVVLRACTKKEHGHIVYGRLSYAWKVCSTYRTPFCVCLDTSTAWRACGVEGECFEAYLSFFSLLGIVHYNVCGESLHVD